MNCRRCKGENPPGAAMCVHCHYDLSAPPPMNLRRAPAAFASERIVRQTPDQVAAALGGMAAGGGACGQGAATPRVEAPDVSQGTRPTAPTRVAIPRVRPQSNRLATVAFCLGIFSAIPCLGPFLGIPAVTLGILGLRHAAARPQAAGKTQAWLGIILGGVFWLVWITVLVIDAVERLIGTIMETLS